MKKFLALIFNLLLILFLWAGSRSWGSLPPIIPFFSPFEGFWANATSENFFSDSTIQLPNDKLKSTTTVYFDKDGIPYIFASDTHNLYFVQGYITARDRLFQMDISSRAHSGFLSELIGERTLSRDLFMRRFGMRKTAEDIIAQIANDTETMSILEAYSNGVNAYISTLNQRTRPFEYKLLDTFPSLWSPIKCIYIELGMRYQLSAFSDDLRNSNTLNAFGSAFFDEVLNYPPIDIEPIIPIGTKFTQSATIPVKPNTLFLPEAVDSLLPFQPSKFNGSNNWVVAARKTQSGFPILASDPHLGLTIPSIWYHINLTDPLHTVRGVSIPGIPGIPIGYNTHIAFAETNVGSDVMDFYQITFKDSLQNEYLYDGKWIKTEKIIETIRLKSGGMKLDTVVYTHHGPVLYGKSMSNDDNKKSSIGYALKWIGHETTNILKPFLKLNRARNFDDYKEALYQFQTPAQNFAFASITGDIAIWSNGKFPLKWHEQGRFIGDGSNPTYDWKGWIPFEENPHIKNPARGYLSSSNQTPVDDSYPYWLLDDFGSHERGRRINLYLKNNEAITPDDMRILQTDAHSILAENMTPVLIDAIKNQPFDKEQTVYLELLKNWDYVLKADSPTPTIFHKWWSKLYPVTFDEFNSYEGTSFSYPSRDRFSRFIIEQPNSRWFDIDSTEVKETFADVALLAFQLALSELEASYGAFGQNWRWANYNKTQIEHIALIPGLGTELLETDGYSETINAIRGTHGPSWRMVVELGEKIKAEAIYPGGQSGNPGSPLYMNFIDDWVEGRLRKADLVTKPEEIKDLTYTLTFEVTQ